MYNLSTSTGEFTGDIPVKAGANIEVGGLFGIDATGHAVNIAATGVVKVAGRAELNADNTGGADGAISLHARRGAMHMDNSEAGPVTHVHIGANVYAEDPQTVRFDQSDAEAVAGKFLGFDSAGLCIVDTTAA